jgi:hypothetical protein
MTNNQFPLYWKRKINKLKIIGNEKDKDKINAGYSEIKTGIFSYAW